MFNPFSEIKWNPDLAERKKFAVSLIIGFPCIAAFFLLIHFIRKHELVEFPLWLGGIGLASGVVFWLLPQISKPFYLIWYFIASCMGFVMGNLIFSGVFYLVVTPIGLVMRAVGKYPLQKGFNKAAPTYWKTSPTHVDSKQYYRQF